MAGESSSSEFYSNMKNQQNSGSSTSLSSSSTSNRLKGMEAFTLDYHVGWPLSIVLSRRVITKYQLLSRLLYFSKHVERRLLTTWMSHQTCKELLALAHRYTRRSTRGNDADDSNQLSAEQRQFITNVQQLFALRHRMLHFIQNFVYYITLEVIYPHHHEFFAHLHGTSTEYTNNPSMHEEDEDEEEDGYPRTSMGADGSGNAGGAKGINIQDMDAILEIHEKFLDICLKECLLASQDLLKILMKLMTTCLLFTDHMIKFMSDIQSLIHQTGPSSNTGGGRSGTGGGRGYQEEDNVFTVPAGSSSSAASSPNKDSQISKKAKKFQQFYNSRQEKMQEYTYLLQQEIQQEAFQRILQKFMLTFDSQVRP
jgi:gamma-tubulin complex component 2